MVTFSITGNLVDVHQKRIYPAEIIVENGKNKIHQRNSRLTLPSLSGHHSHIIFCPVLSMPMFILKVQCWFHQNLPGLLLFMELWLLLATRMKLRMFVE